MANNCFGIPLLKIIGNKYFTGRRNFVKLYCLFLFFTLHFVNSFSTGLDYYHTSLHAYPRTGEKRNPPPVPGPAAPFEA